MKTAERYFSFVVKTEFDSKVRFDQCGVVMYLDSENWLKGSIEYENEVFQHLGSVATNNGYSDWATTQIDAGIKSMWYRFSRRVCFEKDGKLWFCTNNTKDVYKDILANPEVEVSVSSSSYAWIRLAGKAVFENNMEVKEACMANPIVKGQYNEASNPIFEVFYPENPHGVIADFSGNPPYEF